jgi:hypothetical protein
VVSGAIRPKLLNIAGVAQCHKFFVEIESGRCGTPVAAVVFNHLVYGTLNVIDVKPSHDDRLPALPFLATPRKLF